MAWRRSGDKPLSEPMMVNLLTHICVTRPQWVNDRLAFIGPCTWCCHCPHDCRQVCQQMLKQTVYSLQTDWNAPNSVDWKTVTINQLMTMILNLRMRQNWVTWMIDFNKTFCKVEQLVRNDCAFIWISHLATKMVMYITMRVMYLMILGFIKQITSRLTNYIDDSKYVRILYHRAGCFNILLNATHDFHLDN